MSVTLGKLTASANMSSCGPPAAASFNESLTEQMQAMKDLKHYTYGVAMPVICALGIVGNLLNLLVLTRKNMKSVAYCYMRGYAASSLVALLLAVPFCLRILLHGETRSWQQYSAALYFGRLELYLGNGFIGLSVLMLVALTTERYISVCHPVRAHNQTNEGRRARIILALLPICTFIIFSPYTLRTSVVACVANNSTSYRIAENLAFTQSTYYLVYKWTLKILYKIAPTVAITYLNLQIYWSYRRVCRKRRSLVHMSREQRAQQTDEHRLMMLLGSTATLFFFCNLPMVILSVSFTQAMIWSYPFQVFRAVSNVLEIVNYSMTFYIYCLFTKEFRDTFFKTIGLREHSSVLMVPSKSSKTDV